MPRKGCTPLAQVFKVVTLAGALAEGHADLDDTFRNDNGTLFVEGSVIRDGSDHFPHKIRPTIYPTPLAWSSNVTFAQLGLELGSDGMREIARDFRLWRRASF